MVGLAFLLAAARAHVYVFERHLCELPADVEEVGYGEGDGEHDVGFGHSFRGVVGEGVGDFVGEHGGESGFRCADGEDAWGGGGGQ